MDFHVFNQRVGFDLPEYQVDIIRHHASAPMEAQLQQRDCKEYTSLGTSIMRCAFALNMYLERGIRDVNELSRRVTSCRQHLTSSLCKEYSLEDFVIVGPGENPQSKHQDIAQRFVAAIYITFGFLKVYDLLTPFFEGVPAFSVGLYKTLVQQYAQAKHASLSYRVIEKAGPVHAQQITCELRIGSEAVLGTAIGKKKAEIEAAKLFSQRHGLTPPISETKQIPGKSTNSQAISKARAKSLSRARDILHISDKDVPNHQLDTILTHISYASEHPEAESNVALHMIGSTVLDMLANDHIYHDYSVEHASVREVVTLLVSDDRIGKTMPNSIIGSLRVARSFNNKAAINVTSVKADISKALLAQLWINFCQTREASYGATAHQLVAGIVEALEDEPLLNYTSLLQELVQANGYKTQSKVSVSGPANKPIYTVDLAISTDLDTLRVHGTGTSKNRAFADAARRILPTAIGKSPNNAAAKAIGNSLASGCRLVRKSNRTPSKAEAVTDDEFNIFRSREVCEIHSSHEIPPTNRQRTPGNQTTSSKRPELDEQTPEPIADASETQPNVDTGDEVHSDTIEDAEGRTEAEDDDNSTPSLRHDTDGCEDDGGSPIPMEPRLYVCLDSYDCCRRGHSTAAGTWELRDLEGNTIYLETCHCEDCGVDLVDYATYRTLRDSRGPLLGSYVIVQRWRAGRIDRDVPGDVPVLTLLGYGVSDVLGLTHEHRRLILSNSIAWGTLKRDEVVARLSYLFDSTDSEGSLKTARSKWGEDLAWLLGQDA